jgi:hypothetical protein
VNVVIDVDDLQSGGPGRVVDGPALSAAVLRAMTCDSALHRLVMSGRSAVLDYGRATRTIPASLWNALVLRDEHCRFPGCDRRSGWCEGHDVVHIAEDGPTCLENLVLACSRHHHRLHQPRWHAKLWPDATLEVTDPDGSALVNLAAPGRTGAGLMAARSWPPRALVRGSSTTGCNGHSEGADSKMGSDLWWVSFLCPAFRGVSSEVPIPARNPAGRCQGHARTIAGGSPGRSACRAARPAGDDARHARPAVLLASALSTNCRA